MNDTITVIGGVNIDISGRPNAPLKLYDSNISSISVTFGGVGRNIAEDIARLGFSPRLVAAIGADSFSDALVSSCESAGIDASGLVRLEGERNGIYLCVLDDAGDLHLGMNDMAVAEKLTPQMIDMVRVDSSLALVLDANLSKETLLFAARNAKIPVIADPISLKKAERLREALPYLFAIKPNLMQAKALTLESDPVRAARALVRLGVKRAYVSLGADGMAYSDGTASGLVEAVRIAPADVVSTSGAGDSATAAIACATVRGYSAISTARAACRVAAATVQTASAVSTALTPRLLDEE